MAMRILPDFLMSSSASALAIWLTPITAATATSAVITSFFIVSSVLRLLGSLTSFIHVGELGDPPTEFLCCRELGVEIGRDQVFGEPGAYDLRADAHYIDVVVLD